MTVTNGKPKHPAIVWAIVVLPPPASPVKQATLWRESDFTKPKDSKDKFLAFLINASCPDFHLIIKSSGNPALWMAASVLNLKYFLARTSFLISSWRSFIVLGITTSGAVYPGIFLSTPNFKAALLMARLSINTEVIFSWRFSGKSSKKLSKSSALSFLSIISLSSSNFLVTQ